MRRAWLVGTGVLLFGLWFGCWATTVVPASPAVTMQWLTGNASAALTGAAFGAAMAARSQ